MRTTLNVDDDLVAKASELTGVEERTALIHMGLEALIAQKSAQRLAKLLAYDLEDSFPHDVYAIFCLSFRVARTKTTAAYTASNATSPQRSRSPAPLRKIPLRM